jgi:hypothetical protein
MRSRSILSRWVAFGWNLGGWSCADLGSFRQLYLLAWQNGKQLWSCHSCRAVFRQPCSSRVLQLK